MQVFSNPEAFVTQLPATYLVVCLTVLVVGPGRLSLDSMLGLTKKEVAA
jgi:uncharacterized membrane protein YphA (DoxX/SURF4 family)